MRGLVADPDVVVLVDVDCPEQRLIAQAAIRVVCRSPVLDWTETIKANCARTGLPGDARLLAVPWLTAGPLASIVGLSKSVPLRLFDWITRTAELTTPALILHGMRDSSAPIRLSQALQGQRPDLVTLETFDADHTFARNSDS